MDPLLKVAVCGISIAGYCADCARVPEMPPPLLEKVTILRPNNENATGGFSRAL